MAAAEVDEWGQNVTKKDAAFGRMWQAEFRDLTEREGVILARAIGAPSGPETAAVYCAFRAGQAAPAVSD